MTGNQAGDHATIALGYVNSHLGVLGLGQADLTGMELSDSVYTEVTGATHLYWQQSHSGVPVYNSQLHANVNRDGRMISVNNSFSPNIAGAANSSQPAVGAGEAVLSGALHASINATGAPAVLGGPTGPTHRTLVDKTGISAEPIEASLAWLPIHRNDVRLVWNFQIFTLNNLHAYEMTVDAATGKVLTRFDMVVSDDYNVYPVPVEAPSFTSPLPPADGRVIVTDPADSTASPFGWHDVNGVLGAEFTIMRGNNVHSYDDANNSNSPPAVQPDCGITLVCDFPVDLTLNPAAYRSAAVANLYYWNNVIHDVEYQYGFDSAGGNFQENTYGGGGIGSDSVNAEAQDGGGLNNANMLTLPDGSNPRMQMYLWTLTSLMVDGDFDNGIIVHEYGHGISIRLVGGPSNVGCLSNTQQPGEGISDWHSLVYTHEVGDAGTDPRGIGTYALGQPTTGNGIRTQRYSTDPSINNHTYESIDGMVVPHGVGEVWGTVAWEVYWALVDAHTFDPDLYNALGGSGNQRALLYFTEGMKNTICSPTFADMRDGIIQAATDNFAGEDVCLIWDSFAAFGLGSDANDADPNSLNVKNGFNVPVECGGTPPTVISFKIKMDHERFNPNELAAKVRIGDPGAKVVVARATVDVTFDLPDGIQVTNAVSNGNGWATFIIPTIGGGTCTLDVDNITHPDYTYDPLGGTSSASIPC